MNFKGDFFLGHPVCFSYFVWLDLYLYWLKSCGRRVPAWRHFFFEMLLLYLVFCIFSCSGVTSTRPLLVDELRQTCASPRAPFTARSLFRFLLCDPMFVHALKFIMKYFLTRFVILLYFLYSCSPKPFSFPLLGSHVCARILWSKRIINIHWLFFLLWSFGTNSGGRI